MHSLSWGVTYSAPRSGTPICPCDDPPSPGAPRNDSELYICISQFPNRRESSNSSRPCGLASNNSTASRGIWNVQAPWEIASSLVDGWPCTVSEFADSDMWRWVSLNSVHECGLNAWSKVNISVVPMHSTSKHSLEKFSHKRCKFDTLHFRCCYRVDLHKCSHTNNTCRHPLFTIASPFFNCSHMVWTHK